ncbi:phenylalanine--tRNA ligase beta subunit [Actinorhabdospora filicis]|uniref:Phenylalanine--tRNA ligase beta subunit n=1 Tax=Actinorhabdospora filicis TaxID=1785913 RepID=A0A9W6SGY6_9ACTN|nr:phenylalanine--tRNA ligase subunit beta [Actinorhabdospora filicis]GLZ75226.1 phenylalanine--tRNA ligase beta subunit [Actinorhabdospora filicis]
MLVSRSWLREYVAIPEGATALDIDTAFVRAGLEIEAVTDLSEAVTGPLVVGRVVSIEELTEFKKPIRHCHVEVGEAEPRSIICGARNFAEGDLVVVALPGTVLPGGFAIASRKTYGRLSDGMICSARELGVSDEHDGIIVLPAGTPEAPGTDARSIVGLDDVIFEINVTPDRGYCFSVRGLARELAQSLGVAFTDPAELTAPAIRTAEGPHPLRVDDTTGCPRFALRAVHGVDPAKPSPEWMKRRLAQSGMRSISLAVDVTNYLMLELGQPLHAFDRSALRGGLVVRRAEAGEKLTTLDDVQRVLEPEDIVIADDTGVISLAGVMGGQTSEVAPDTTEVMFEAASWEPVSIARTSRRHKLVSEAGKRFERGVDPALCAVAVNRAAELMVEYGGAVMGDHVTDLDHRVPAAPATLPIGLAARLAGVDYTPEEVVAALETVGCRVTADGETLTVTPPSWRPDLTDPADYAEEVIRVLGVERIVGHLPRATPGRGLTARQRRRRTVGRALADAGYVETPCYPFVAPEVHDAFGLDAADPRRRALRIANPISAAEPELRTSLLPPLLAALKRNIGRGHKDLALYEVGQVFLPKATEVPVPDLPVAHRPSDEELAAVAEAMPDQPRHVAAVLAGSADLAGWWGAGRAADWSDAVEAARVVARASGVELDVAQGEHAPWHPGRCAELRAGDVVVGHAGELHPAVCEALELPRRTCAMELNLDLLPYAGKVAAPSVSTYPPARIDVAVVVDAATPSAAVASALAQGAGELLEDIELFDVYQGERLGEGRKSLAYRLTFRALDRTLTAEEAVGYRDAAVAAAASVGATLRDV